MYRYEIIRTKRKTLALEITPERRLLVRAPLRTPDDAIAKFVSDHEKWITKHMSAPPREVKKPGAEDRARLSALLGERVRFYSAVMGVVPTGVKITSARKRWGSCSARNSLCFSDMLCFADPRAVDAVVVHELAHIRCKDHSKAFYAVVSGVLADYGERMKLLK